MSAKGLAPGCPGAPRSYPRTVFEFLSLLLSWLSGEAGWRMQVRHETKELRLQDSVLCLYREAPEDVWRPKTCRVMDDGLEFTMFPFGAAFVLQPASVTVLGDGPMMAEGSTTMLTVRTARSTAEMAVPDVMLDWFLARVSGGPS